MRVILGFLLLLGSLPAQTPPSIPAKNPTLTLIDSGEGRRVWHSRRFEITSTAAIPERPLQRMAAVVDAAVEAVASHPLPIFKPPQDDRLRIVILHDDASYAAEGGLAGSAGMYLGRKQCVVIHGQHLFSRPVNSRLQAGTDEDLLVHEVTHLCMHGNGGRLPQWLNEGICEYFAAAHQGAGRFIFKDMDRAIRDHLRRRTGSTDSEITATPVADVGGLDSREWSELLAQLSPEDRLRPYSTALLLAHYHLHGGDARRSKVDQGLNRTSPRSPDPFETLGQQDDVIQQQLSTYWRSKGLRVSFGETSPQP